HARVPLLPLQAEPPHAQVALHRSPDGDGAAPALQRDVRGAAAAQRRGRDRLAARPLRGAGPRRLHRRDAGALPPQGRGAARHRSGRFFNFNGTAGIWRRCAIDDAGGWSHDTLTEDMDLSYRAQLRGWQFVYLPDVVSDAELPVEMNSFKSQQFRWAKGSIQV